MVRPLDHEFEGRKAWDKSDEPVEEPHTGVDKWQKFSKDRAAGKEEPTYTKEQIFHVAKEPTRHGAPPVRQERSVVTNYPELQPRQRNYQDWSGFRDARQYEERAEKQRKRDRSRSTSKSNRPESPKEYTDYPDNEGDEMWRKREKPHVYELAIKRSDLLDGMFFGDRNMNIRNIADKTKTHIAIPDTNIRNQITELEIWGDPDNVADAKKQLTDLFKSVDREEQEAIKSKTQWNKIKAGIIGRKREIWNEELLERARLQEFKRLPAHNQLFKAWGIFYWPKKELNIQNALGINYEALDEVRFDCECYITYSAQRSCFRIQGDDPAKIQEATDRVYNMFCEIAAKNRKPTRMHLIHPPNIASATSEIALSFRHDLKGKQLSVRQHKNNPGVLCILVPQNLTVQQRSEWGPQREKIFRANEIFLRQATERALRDLYHYRGFIKFRVYFGTLILFAYQRAENGRHKLPELMNMLRNSQTYGEVIRYVGGPEVGEKLVAHCDSLTDVFQPAHLNASNASISWNDVEPQYSATFTIRCESTDAPDVHTKLEVVFERVPGENKYRVCSSRWLMIPRQDGAEAAWNRRKAPLEVKMIDLDAELACQFDMFTANYTKETDIYTIFGDFVLRVSLDQVRDETLPNKPLVWRVSFVNLPGMIVESVVQKQKFQYWILSTPYIFEITKYEYLPTEDIKKRQYTFGIPINFNKTESDTRYGASLYSIDWDATLSKQNRLGHGKVADWKPSIEHFFANSKAKGFGSNGGLRKAGFAPTEKESSNPNDPIEDGFSELCGRVTACMKLIKEIRDRVKQAKDREEALKQERQEQEAYERERREYELTVEQQQQALERTYEEQQNITYGRPERIPRAYAGQSPIKAQTTRGSISQENQKPGRPRANTGILVDLEDDDDDAHLYSKPETLSNNENNNPNMIPSSSQNNPAQATPSTTITRGPAATSLHKTVSEAFSQSGIVFGPRPGEPVNKLSTPSQPNTNLMKTIVNSSNMNFAAAANNVTSPTAGTGITLGQRPPGPSPAANASNAANANRMSFAGAAASAGSGVDLGARPGAPVAGDQNGWPAIGGSTGRRPRQK